MCGFTNEFILLNNVRYHNKILNKQDISKSSITTDILNVQNSRIISGMY